MNLASNSRKVLTSTVVAATIAWSMGLSALTASAVVMQPGTLIKASLPTVYYLGADNKRYVFPNQDTYKTWYADFSGVQTITDAELASLPLGGNVTFRPGVQMIKITTDPKTYAVAKGGVLRWIKTEAAAQALYGSNWNKNVKDVADSFFTNYTIGADINSSADFMPATEMSNSGSINVDKNLAVGSDLPVISGTMTAMLSASQPMGTTLPKGATGVNMVKVDVRNSGSTAVIVDSMVVRRTGVGSSADFSYVYLYEGSNRLTTGRTINSSTNDATFGGINLSIAAGETKNLWVSADLAAGGLAGNQNAIQIVSITSGSVAAAGLPVTGPSFTLAGSSVGQITIAANGGTLANVDAGTTAKVAQFEISATGNEDIIVNKVALYFTGNTARENVTNLTLKQAGNTLATAAGISSKDLVTFVLSSPLTMAKGNSRVFEVYADISANARAAETVAFYLDNDSDLYAVGATYGAGVSVVRTGYDNGTGAPTDASSVTIEAGSIGVTYNGPAAKNIAVDAKDVELLNFTINAQSNVEVRNLRTSLTAANAGATPANDGLINETTVTANYTDIKLVDVASGATVGSADLLTGGSDTVQNLTFNSVFNIAAGQVRTFKMTADIANNAALAAGTADTIKGSLLAFVLGDIRNLDNNTSVALSEIVPNSGITGNAHTLLASSMVVSAASTPVVQTYIKGAQGVALGGLILKAGDAGDMKVSSITLKPNVGSVAATAYVDSISTASLWNGATQLGSSKSPTTTTGVLIFDNLNLTVPSGQSVTVTLKGNLSSLAAAGTYRYELNANGDISVTDADGSSKSATGAAATFNLMTVAAAGTIAVALAPDDTDSEAGLVVAGSSNVVLAKYKFTAADEELKLAKVRLHTATPNAVQSLSLYDNATLVGGPVGVDGSGNADFTGLNFIILKDASKVLTVKGNLGTVGTGGATTASDVKVTLMDTAGTLEVRGTSAGSSTLIIDIAAAGLKNNDGSNVGFGDDIAANSKVIRKTKPTFALAALPSTLLGNGDKTMIRFSVSADAAGDVALETITFNVALSDAAGGAPALAVATAAGSAGKSSVRPVGGDYIAGSYTAGVVSFTTEEVIAAGTTKNYELVLAVTGSGTDDAIVTSILGSDAATATAAVAAGMAGNLVWSDMSINGGLTSATWTGGFKVKGIPTDSATLSR
jgi:hypothetical protein